MKKTILNYVWALVLLGVFSACDQNQEVAPHQPTAQTSGFNLKEFIGIYEAQVLNFVNTSSLVISRVDERFQGSQMWIGAHWEGTEGARVKINIVERNNNNGETIINIPSQAINDAVTIDGRGTFYYYDGDFFLDVNYNLTQNNKTNNYSIVAVKKVFNQSVIVNVSVDCECECECDGDDCDCTCDCDD